MTERIFLDHATDLWGTTYLHPCFAAESCASDEADDFLNAPSPIEHSIPSQ